MSCKGFLTRFFILILAHSAQCEYVKVVQNQALYHKIEEYQGNNGSHFNRTITATSFSQCAFLCTNQAGCEAFTYENAVCRFMRNVSNSSHDYYIIINCPGSNPCYNGGICIRQPFRENIFCICPNNYYGTYCEFHSTTAALPNTTTTITTTTRPGPSPPGNTTYFYTATGTILSPNYPENYGNNINHYYVIRGTSATKSHTFHVNYMQLESHSICGYDSVKIYSGTYPNGNLEATLCGTGPFNDITTTGQHAYIHFSTDSSRVYTGFDISYISAF